MTFKSWVFDIQRYSIQDGPGIRTTVFLKGCPLRCLWCDNPESQNPFPELLYFKSLCIKCHHCVASCPNGAITTNSNGELQIDRGLCRACGSCVSACLREARAISGKLMTVEEVLQIIEKDSLFYRNSCGGATFSGGEPTYQPRFLLEALKSCQEHGFHTAVETCSYVEWEVFEGILEYVDLVLADIKHMDPVRHKQLTGVDNQLILQNIRRIVQKRVPLVLRMPLIPGINDSEENVNASGRFAVDSGIARVDILPYHRFGLKKYEAIGKMYKLKDPEPLKPEQIEAIKMLLESYELTVSII